MKADKAEVAVVSWELRFRPAGGLKVYRATVKSSSSSSTAGKA
jgi:hypothetical protein